MQRSTDYYLLVISVHLFNDWLETQNKFSFQYLIFFISLFKISVLVSLVVFSSLQFNFQFQHFTFAFSNDHFTF